MEQFAPTSSVFSRIYKLISDVINFARPEYIDLEFEQKKALQEKYREEGRAAFFGIGSTSVAVVVECAEASQHEQDMLTHQD